METFRQATVNPDLHKHRDPSLVAGATSGGGGAASSAAFSPKVDYPAGVNPNAISAGDFNADAVPDIAVANESSGTLSILTGVNTLK